MAFEAFFPHFNFSGGTDERKGDGIVMECSGKYMIVDAFEGGDATNGIKTWLSNKGKNYIDIAVLTHPHWDHYNGMLQLLDAGIKIKLMYCYDPLTLKHGCDGSKNGKAVAEDMDNAYKVIKRIQAAGGIVKYIDHGATFAFGDITWRVYRNQPTEFTEFDTGEAWAFINDGSLVLYSPETELLLGGDGPCDIKYALQYFNAPVSGYDIAHHGNNCSESNAKSLKDHGCVVAWESCIERNGAGTTDWTAFGARRVKQQGIPVWMQNEDIYIYAESGKITFRQGSKTISKAVPYNGKPKTGWIKDGTGWYYRKEDGSCAYGWTLLPWSGSKKKDKKDWFYFDNHGYMVTGWKHLKCSQGFYWFYFDSKNGDMKTGWIYDNGYWYFTDSNGVMQTGWVEYKGKKCYLEPVSGKNQGHAYCNQIATIDGKTYSFDKDCYATEITDSDITVVTGKLNNMSPSRKQFAIDIANYVRKYAPQYGICVYSPIIAQAIHESGWGESKLSSKYHNYFGLKCGTNWNGKSVNMRTLEEYSPGTLTNISANFRAYDNMEEGVKGYFDFIQLPRYANLKGVTDPRQYLQNIKNDGYATGSQYVTNTMNLVNLYNLTQFDVPIKAEDKTDKTENADPIDVMLQIASAEVGYHEGANNHTKYGDEMHSIQPSNMDANAAWCDAFVDWCVLQTCKAFGYGADMAREALCGDFDDYTYASVNLYKKAGRWTQTAARGNQIFFGGSGHTGVVESVDSKVHTIEGNKSDQVMRCSYSPNDSRIIGYGMPKYELLGGEISVDNYPLIKRGSTGYFVLQLQKLLNAKNYSGKETLTEDGDFGAKTEAQVKLYQQSNGLTVDGEVGPMTWGKLTQ